MPKKKEVKETTETNKDDRFVDCKHEGMPERHIVHFNDGIEYELCTLCGISRRMK